MCIRDSFSSCFEGSIIRISPYLEHDFFAITILPFPYGTWKWKYVKTIFICFTVRYCIWFWLRIHGKQVRCGAARAGRCGGLVTVDRSDRSIRPALLPLWLSNLIVTSLHLLTGCFSCHVNIHIMYVCFTRVRENRTLMTRFRWIDAHNF